MLKRDKRLAACRIHQAENQILVTQLPVLLENRTTQHRLDRQALSAGVLNGAWVDIAATPLSRSIF